MSTFLAGDVVVSEIVRALSGPDRPLRSDSGVPVEDCQYMMAVRLPSLHASLPAALGGKTREPASAYHLDVWASRPNYTCRG